MSLVRAELQEAARRAFAKGELAPDRDKSWGLITDLGWLTAGVPEDLGGLGLDREATGAIHMELGRALVPGPAIAQMMVIEALCAADGVPEREALLERAMGGELMTVSLAGAPAATLTCAPDADQASHLLVLGDEKVALVQPAAATYRETWDKTRRLFDVTLTAAPELVLAEGGAARALCEHLQSLLLLALAADSLGGAQAALDLTVDYLKTRRQFGRPLALFQALKHRVADLRTWLSAAEALFWNRAADPAATLTQMGALKAHATSVYRQITEEAIQLHGGIGLTMEHTCHLFLKRAMLNSALGGDADHWEEAAGRQALALAAERQE
jgi:alkylation response protein AidB-like acyl-CoA dehydrogenase